MTALVIAALIPAIVLLMFIYKQDKVEKEPVGLLVKILVLGAISCIPAALLETFFGGILEGVFPIYTIPYIVLENFIVVAVSEESCKMLAAKIGAWKSKEFNYKFDAIVYCVTSALGFAALENILYVVEGGFSVAVSRALLSVPSHAIDGVMMGYFFGIAKEAELRGDKGTKKIYLLFSVCVPAIAHGFYDCALSLDSAFMMLLFFIFVIAVDIWAIIFIRKQSKGDYAIDNQQRI